jgi:hypothetical protein
MSAINRVLTANIPNGQSLSQAVYVGAAVPTGIQMPAAWDAANITFQGSADGVTFYDVYDITGAEAVVVAAAARYIPLGALDFNGMIYFKVRSGTTGAPVNQTAARAISIQNRIFGYAS